MERSPGYAAMPTLAQVNNTKPPGYIDGACSQLTSLLEHIESIHSRLVNLQNRLGVTCQNPVAPPSKLVDSPEASLHRLSTITERLAQRAREISATVGDLEQL